MGTGCSKKKAKVQPEENNKSELLKSDESSDYKRRVSPFDNLHSFSPLKDEDPNDLTRKIVRTSKLRKRRNSEVI